MKIVDFTSEYESDETPTAADLTLKAQTYAENNDIEIPHVNLSVAFVPLYQTEEYKNIAPLERVSLGDTVHVDFPKLGVTATARVIKTEWDSELKRYESVELGDAKANMNTIINEAVNEAKKSSQQDKTFIEDQLNEMASLIINGLGLHRTLVPVAGGGYRIYLHNKETLEDSDTQYVMSANGFLVSTDYGQTWNAGFDSEGNAVLNSLATITLKALEISGSSIRGSVITFGSTKTMTMQTNSDSTGVLFEGDGNVDFESQGHFTVTNKSVYSATDIYNRLTLDYGQAVLSNYNASANNIQAGRFYLSSSSEDNNASVNNYDIGGSGAISSMIYSGSTQYTNYVTIDVRDASGVVKGKIDLSYEKSTGKAYVNVKADGFFYNGSQKW